MMRRAAPFLACVGLLLVWQLASLALKNDSFPTALEAIRAIPAKPACASWRHFMMPAASNPVPTSC